VEEVFRARAQGSELRIGTLIAGEDEDGKKIVCRKAFAEFTHDFEAIHVRHVDIEKQDIGMQTLEGFKGLALVVDDVNLEVALQHALDEE
jgi:hypothetical protein